MLKHPENYLYEDIKNKIIAMPLQEFKICLCLLYGCGVRVSELNQIEAENILETIDKKGRAILRIHSVTLKNKTDHERFIPIYIEEEPWLADPLIEYKKGITGRLFPIHRATIWRWCVKNFGINPHGFRKIRLTHLVTEFNFSDQQLTKFAGWTDSRPAKAYVRLNIEDIVPERRR